MSNLIAGTVVSGQKTVTAAGTAEQLTTTGLSCTRIIIQALAGNGGAIYIGNDGADDVTSANGFILGATEGANDRIELSVADPAQIWVDAAVNGEGVSWIAEVL